jgi:hypothetical protein
MVIARGIVLSEIPNDIRKEVLYKVTDLYLHSLRLLLLNKYYIDFFKFTLHAFMNINIEKKILLKYLFYGSIFSLIGKGYQQLKI